MARSGTPWRTKGHIHRRVLIGLPGLVFISGLAFDSSSMTGMGPPPRRPPARSDSVGGMSRTGALSRTPAGSPTPGSRSEARVAGRARRAEKEHPYPVGMGTMGRPPPRTGSGSAPSSPAHSVDSAGGSVSGTKSGGGGGGGSAVKVVVRVRPLNKTELSRGDRETVIISDDQRSVNVGNRTFDFNACLSPDTTQPDVMIKCGIRPARLGAARVRRQHIRVRADGLAARRSA